MPSKTIVIDGQKIAVSQEQLKRRLMRAERHGATKRRERDMNLYATHVVGKPIDQWDLEELSRGKVRNKNGRFTGGPRFAHIQPLIDREIAKRLKYMALREIQGNVYTAIDVLAELMRNAESEAIRLRAAMVVIEYTLGTPQQNIKLTDEAQGIAAKLASALVTPAGLPAHPVIEGTVVDADEADTDDELEDDNELQ